MLDGAGDVLGNSIGSTDGNKGVVGLPVGDSVPADGANDTVRVSLG